MQRITRRMRISLQHIYSITDFVRNASEHAGRIRESGQAEILTQHGKPCLAVLPAEQYEKLLDAHEYLEAVQIIQQGLDAAEQGLVRPADEVFNEWRQL